jgi:hypothetical protein
MTNKKISIALSIFLLVISSTGHAQEKSEEELAKATQNPLASMISLPFQNNTNFGMGPDDDTQNTLNIQPVWPFSLGENWNFVTRTIIPVVSQPGFGPGESRTNGLGDVTFTGWVSPKSSGKWIWGVGGALVMPTASDDVLGNDRWSVGPSIVVLTMPGKWVVGSLVSNVWSVGGSGEQDVNFFTWQYFINYNMDNGWYLTSAPIITANWEENSDNTWTVPFGGGVGKIFRIGKQPLNAQISAYYNVEKPEFGADWQLRLQLQMLFPK